MLDQYLGPLSLPTFGTTALLIPLAACSINFPILAGVKANNGEVWKYPLAITFLK